MTTTIILSSALIITIIVTLFLLKNNSKNYIALLKAKDESVKNLEEIIKQIEEKSQISFKNIANEILNNQSDKLTEKNKENLENVLNPLKENIKDFKEKVELSQKETKQQYDVFGERIKNLAEQTQNISKEASELAKALKGQKKMQGDWGEQILENILIDAGLVKGIDYDTQVNIKDDENNNLRPDFIINLPNQHKIIIDSKLSLNSYVEYYNTESDEMKQKCLKDFMSAVKTNIDSLAKRNYEKNLKDSLDFVFMFFPVENAYLLAINYDNSLLKYAYEKGILLIAQTNLLTSLRIVSDLWRREKQDKNIAKIIAGVEDLYKKFTEFAEEFEKIGETIDKSKDKYDNAMKKLRTGKGNVLKRTQDLNELGIKTKKKLPKSILDLADTEDIDYLIIENND